MNCAICGLQKIGILTPAQELDRAKNPVCMCRNRPKVLANLDTRTTIRSKNFPLYTLGIELEASRWSQSRDITEGARRSFGNVPGRFVHDGSVSSGYEWVSDPITPHPSKWLSNRYQTSFGLIDDLLSIGDYWDSQKIGTDHTCGLHVHIDCRNWSVWEVVKVWSNYIAIQDFMYMLCAPEREAPSTIRAGRTYCNRYTTTLQGQLYHMLMHEKPSVIKKWLTEQLFEVSDRHIKMSLELTSRRRNVDRFNGGGNAPRLPELNGDFLRNSKNYKYHNNRYFGLNVLSFFAQGSLEFRMQGHPYDEQDIVLWPLFCCLVLHRLHTGPLLQYAHGETFETFLKWLEPNDVLEEYIVSKHKQFRTAREQSTIVPTYMELV